MAENKKYCRKKPAKEKKQNTKKGRVQQNHTSFKVENRVALHVPFIKAVQKIKGSVDKINKKKQEAGS